MIGAEIQVALLANKLPDILYDAVNNPLLAVITPSTPSITSKPGHTKNLTVKPGDTLGGLFKRADLPLVAAIKLAKAEEATPLSKLQPG